MRKKYIINNKPHLKRIFTVVVVILVLIGCVFIDSVSILQVQEDGTEAARAKVNTEATFTIKGSITCQEDHKDVRFVVSFLAPKSWNVRQNGTVTYVTTLHTDQDEVLPMRVIPESSLPKNGGGRTWGEALIQDYGVGPNVLNDMEWVSFETVDKWEIYNGDKPQYTIYIKTNVGDQNLKAYLGFFVNHTDDGISTSADHKKIKFSDEYFEVYGGVGQIIDFANEHFNKAQPLASLQDDFVTFSFNGGVYANNLTSEDEVYFEAQAYDANDVLIADISEKTAKTLMVRESQYNEVRNLTFWPAQFFNVAEGVTISYIKYVFTNRDGSILITQSDDDAVVNEVPNDGLNRPFVFEFLCY